MLNNNIETIKKKKTLMNVLRRWEWWMDEGQPPYSYKSPSNNKEPQYKYDPYHDGLNKTNDTYEFSIQVYDSPEQDIWWEGKFRVINNVDVEILEEHYSNR